METIRKPYQGVWNVVRFNWHFYLLSFIGVISICLLTNVVNFEFHWILFIVALLLLISSFNSLLASYYAYDLSGLYKLNWLNELEVEKDSVLVNINAGFDEISLLIKNRYPDVALQVFDFYNEETHTEISIKRARKAYTAFENTQIISSAHIQLNDNSVDYIFLFLSAHEIRDEKERTVFFKELKRILKPAGKIIIIEHLRNGLNFIAYNIGFFHFHTSKTWIKAFESAGLRMIDDSKLNLFISKFTLQKNGVAS